MPPAPPMFSMMTGLPRTSNMCGAKIRARMSLDAPAANGTTMVMGRAGQVWARTSFDTASVASAASSVAICFPVMPRSPLIDLDACGLDCRRPFRDFAFDELLQVLRRAPFGRNHGGAVLEQPLLDQRRVERRDGRVIQLLHDRCGRAFGQEKGEPGAGVEIGQALFMRRRNVRQDFRAILRQD